MDEDTIAGVATGMGGGIAIIRVSGPNAFAAVGEIFWRKGELTENLAHSAREMAAGGVTGKNGADGKGDFAGQGKSTELFDRSCAEMAADVVSGKNGADGEVGECKNLRESHGDFFLRLDSHTIHYGVIADDDGTVIDEVMVAIMRAPKSYTCEDVAEIDAHGGTVVVQKILQCLLRHGVRLAKPGEFTRRAYLNGRIDLSQAEAVMKMISSQNTFALDSAVSQLQGRLSKNIEEIRNELLHNMAFVEAALDDPEHFDLEGFAPQFAMAVRRQADALDSLLAHFDEGRIRAEGVNTVICGKPNVGKSTLLNLLANEDCAIVTDVAGTTRDVLTATVQLGQMTLHVSDTAGIRQAQDEIEDIGVKRALASMERADFVIFVMDGSRPLDREDEEIAERLRGKTGVVLINKSDLAAQFTPEDVRAFLEWPVLIFCGKTGQGIDALREEIAERFFAGEVSFNDQVILTSERHREAVAAARESLGRVLETIDAGLPEDLYLVDVMDACDALGLISGQTASEELVDKIFSEFCMGK